MGKIFGIADLPVGTLEQALGHESILPKPNFLPPIQSYKLPQKLGDTDRYISKTHNVNNSKLKQKNLLSRLMNRLTKK